MSRHTSIESGEAQSLLALAEVKVLQDYYIKPTTLRNPNKALSTSGYPPSFPFPLP